MAIYSFANCAMLNAPYLTRVSPLSESIMGLFTEGLCSLLSSTPIGLHPRDKEKLQASDIPAAKVVDADVLPAVTLNPEDVLIWSPLADVATHLIKARDSTGAQYLYSYPAFIPIFGPLRVLTETEILAAWDRFLDLTKNHQHKFAILYPHDRLDNPRFKERLVHLYAVCERLFPRYGWVFLQPDPMPPPPWPNPHWSHYHPDKLRVFQDSLLHLIQSA